MFAYLRTRFFVTRVIRNTLKNEGIKWLYFRFSFWHPCARMSNFQKRRSETSMFMYVHRISLIWERSSGLESFDTWRRMSLNSAAASGSPKNRNMTWFKWFICDIRIDGHQCQKVKKKKIMVFYLQKKENNADVSVKTFLVLIKARNRFKQKKTHTKYQNKGMFVNRIVNFWYVLQFYVCQTCFIVSRTFVTEYDNRHRRPQL